ncbi:hypothetical protein EYF80_032577 [Liparis tanakae]|uniref:Uncharacterized protein n=1 Tax=Liparis tanakae TaxID=230148 RepID=A0A4Z2GWU9_9TELE|nr:hypothetical protein EYF80_032577 [Liparis tanakae]
MKRKNRGSTCTWRGVTARIIRRSYTMRNRSHANPFIPRLENPHAARRPEPMLTSLTTTTRYKTKRFRGKHGAFKSRSVCECSEIG